MDPDVVHDPIYADLAANLEVSARKLRDAVAQMRAFYLSHHKTPLAETTSETWRGALLGELACQRHEAVIESAAQLLRYAFELAPVSNCPIHMEELLKLKAAQKERVVRRTGYGKCRPHPKGIEEKVIVDGGSPITVVINPKHWGYTQRAKNAAHSVKPAIPPDAPKQD